MTDFHLVVPLLVGGALSVFSIGRWPVAWAAWLAPVFLLQFARNAATPAALGGIWLALFAALALSHRRAMPLRGGSYLAFCSGIAAFAVVPYACDLWLASRIPGFASTLIFPLAWTVAELIGSRLSPFGSWGSLAYTQVENLPLMQLAALTGTSGITFLVSWFAGVVNWALALHSEWSAVRFGLALYGLVVSAVLLAGGLRLVLARSAPRRLHVAGVGWPEHIVTQEQMLRVLSSDWSDAERIEQRARYRALQDHVLAAAARLARGGAALVLTPEASLFVLAEDEPAFLARAAATARAENMYLLFGMVTVRLGETRPVDNHATLVLPSGETRLLYRKASAVPGVEARTNLRGAWRLPTVDLPIARIATAICFDLDFPAYVRQVGRAAAEVLLVPAADWPEISLLHHLPAVFRAIENGIAIVRVTRWGMSAAIDPRGRPLAVEARSTADLALSVQVPLVAAGTVYSRVGDVFGWIAAASLAALVTRVLLEG